MRHELEAAEDSEQRRRFLEVFLPVLDREMETARTLASYYPRLGFDPDYLMYRSTVFPFLEQERGMSRQEIAAFCRSSFLSAIVKRALPLCAQSFHAARLFLFSR